MLCLMYVSSHPPSFTTLSYGSVVCDFGCFVSGGEFGFLYCVVYVSCLSSTCLLVMPLMLTCSMDMPVALGVLIGLCGVFLVLV